MSVPVSVTVVVPETIRGAVEGRRTLSLGVPADSSVGDVVDTLLKLYPKLRTHLASDRRGAPQGFNVMLLERDLSRGSTGLRNGMRLYLTAVPGKRPGMPRG